MQNKYIKFGSISEIAKGICNRRENESRYLF